MSGAQGRSQQIEVAIRIIMESCNDREGKRFFHIVKGAVSSKRYNIATVMHVLTGILSDIIHDTPSPEPNGPDFTKAVILALIDGHLAIRRGEDAKGTRH